MDNWTLLSARFDVSEEAMMEVQGRLQRHRRVGDGGVEQVGPMRGEGKERETCTYASEKSQTGYGNSSVCLREPESESSTITSADRKMEMKASSIIDNGYILAND
ncbi:hypothetical protein GBF38_011640 [Nibea albiflora]|uniref:Uncharacterized protein n=1 Tax=Nibea albiflora TaxID=240163 RepID=A0ACB7F4I7_NIBAL|nr:hypothetical protein GBF38_011640 [Nibea albiflora]